MDQQGFELAHHTVSGRELTFHYHFIYYVLCYTFKPKKRTCCSFCQLPCLGLCPYSKTPNCDQLLLFSKDDGCGRRRDTEESLPLLQVGFRHFVGIRFSPCNSYSSRHICVYVYIYDFRKIVQIWVELDFVSQHCMVSCTLRQCQKL